MMEHIVLKRLAKLLNSEKNRFIYIVNIVNNCGFHFCLFNKHSNIILYNNKSYQMIAKVCHTINYAITPTSTWWKLWGIRE